MSSFAVSDTLPRELELEMEEGSTLKQLITYLSSIYDQSLGERVIQDDSLSPGSLVLINGITALRREGLQTVLQHGDEVFLSVMVHGG